MDKQGDSPSAQPIREHDVREDEWRSDVDENMLRFKSAASHKEFRDRKDDEHCKYHEYREYRKDPEVSTMTAVVLTSVSKPGKRPQTYVKRHASMDKLRKRCLDRCRSM